MNNFMKILLKDSHCLWNMTSLESGLRWHQIKINTNNKPRFTIPRSKRKKAINMIQMNGLQRQVERTQLL